MHLEDFINFIKFEKRYSENTVQAYNKDIEQFIVFAKEQFNINTIQEIDFISIRSWIVFLLDNNFETKTVNRKISSLKSYLKFSKKKGFIISNPISKIISPKNKKRLPEFLNKADINKLLDIDPSNNFEGIRDRLIIELLYGTGIRRAELISLEIKDINLNKLQIKVTGKGNKERIIPIYTDLAKRIEEYLIFRNKLVTIENSYNLLITSSGKKIYPKLVYKIVHNQLSLISTLNKKSPHVMRHTFATHLLNNGAEINAIKELLGHSSLAATQVYTQNNIEELLKTYKQAHPKK